MRLRLPGRLPLWGQSKTFQFTDPGPLMDGDLQLIAPGPQWIDAALAACAHPLTIQQAPDVARTTRQNLLDFLRVCPAGRQPASPSTGADAPTYHFWMLTTDPAQASTPIVGGIALRIGNTYDIVMYYGHLGYHVYPPSRGHHYAARACRLLMPLAYEHGIDPIWITCNPENRASRRTCDGTGAQLVETVPVPSTHVLYRRGDFEKCRYRLDTTSAGAK
jgi:predicted acetyltransferase